MKILNENYIEFLFNELQLKISVLYTYQNLKLFQYSLFKIEGVNALPRLFLKHYTTIVKRKLTVVNALPRLFLKHYTTIVKRTSKLTFTIFSLVRYTFRIYKTLVG